VELSTLDISGQRGLGSQLHGTMSEKVQGAVVAEAQTARAIVQDVIMSGAYLYPLKVSG
jgi:hypothetical protein